VIPPAAAHADASGLLGGLSAFQASAGALLAVVVLMILTGRLVPRSVLRDTRRDSSARETQLQKQADAWRDAYELAVQGRKTADEHMAELLDAARTTRQVIEALPQAAGRAGPGKTDRAERKVRHDTPVD